MDVILTAGGVPLPEDPLYPYIQGRPLAMLEVAGRPMVQWVLDAFSRAGEVGRIVLVGLTEKSGLECRKPVTYVPHQGRWIEDLRAGAAKLKKLDPQARYALVASAGLPALPPEAIDWLLQEGKPHGEDLIAPLVGRAVIEKRLPGKKFAYTRLREAQFLPGRLNLYRLDFLLDRRNERWLRLAERTGDPLGQAALLGPGAFFQYLFGRLDLEAAVRGLNQHLGLRLRPLDCPHAGPAMVVSDPDMLEAIEADLKKHLKKAAKTTSGAGRPSPKAGGKPSRKTTPAP